MYKVTQMLSFKCVGYLVDDFLIWGEIFKYAILLCLDIFKNIGLPYNCLRTFNVKEPYKASALMSFF